MFDFNDEINIAQKDIETKFLGRKLILKNIFFYNGPITLQFLPYGGIQAIFNDTMIINTKSGFIATKEVEYNGISYSVGEFSFLFKDLVNTVFPN